MGIGPFKRWSEDTSTDLPVSHHKAPGNPDPLRWDLLEYESTGRLLLLKVRYPDCTNYEGVKILVLKGTTIERVKARKTLDPHFSPDEFSPLARFEPTDLGWKCAKLFALAVHLNGYYE